MLIFPHLAPFKLLFCGCDFSGVPSVTSASRCRQHRAWRGELADRAVVMGCALALATGLSRDLGVSDPSPCAGFPGCEKTNSRVILNYLTRLLGRRGILMNIRRVL